MTSNQINFYATTEAERHNRVSEEEIARHNKETEAIASDSNQITRQYNAEKLALDERLAKLNLEFQSANEGRKRDIEAEQLGINTQLATVESNYKQQMAVIEGRKANVDKVYKEAMANVAQYNAQLQEKRDYYSNQKTEAETYNVFAQQALQLRRLELERASINNAYSLGLLSASQRDTELSINRDKYNLDLEKWNTMKSNVNSETFKNYATAISGAAKTVLDGVRLFNIMK